LQPAEAVPLLAAYTTLGLNPASLLLALALDALEGSSVVEGSSIVEGSSAAKLGSPPAVVFHSCHLCTLAWAAVSSAEPEVSSLVLPLIRIAHAALLGTNTALAGTNTALDGTNTAPSASLAHGADERSSCVHGSLLDLGSSAAKLGHDSLGSSAAKLGHGTLLDLSSAPIWRAVRKTEATTISRELACHADDL
jgi:hypothetical protein